MNLYDVYPLFNIEPVKAKGSYLWDKNGEKYLDLYGGHAVISIGHTHPHYIQKIKEQLDQIGFYSNSVHNTLQVTLSEKLGKLSGYGNYQLFLCNSGAEANENALKLASFTTGRKKIIAFKNAFHGRTSGAVAVTDNAKITSPFNTGHQIAFLPLNDIEAADKAIDDSVAAVIIEGIQGVGGIRFPEASFLRFLREKCNQVKACLILDEVQSGYGRSGRFFAHQHTDVQADLITTAKGMGNGFPIGGVLIHPDIQPWSGQLGTTFGGNYLACAAGIAVLEVIKQEELISHAAVLGHYLRDELKKCSFIKEVRGKGLMIGFDLPEEFAHLRRDLLYKYKIFTGAAGTSTIRLLPALNLARTDADYFLETLHKAVAC